MFNWLLSAFIYKTVVTETNDKLKSLRGTIKYNLIVNVLFCATLGKATLAIFYKNSLTAT